MGCLVLEGRSVAERLRRRAVRTMDDLRVGGIRPRLVLLRVGAHPVARDRARVLGNEAARWGVEVEEATFDALTSRTDLARAVKAWNRDRDTHGIVALRPWPRGCADEVLPDTIRPAKDVEGLHPETIGRAALDAARPAPALVGALRHLLEDAPITLRGARVCVLGRAPLPLAERLQAEGASVVLCPSDHPDAIEASRGATVLVVGVGRPRGVGAAHVAPGATVLDLGVHAETLEDGSWAIVGDVDAEAVLPIAGALTPVPGGVGKAETAVLLENLVRAARPGRDGRASDELPLFGA